jgi:cytochrome c oxidase assembly protein subunit 11
VTRTTRTAVLAVLFVCFMTGLAFASVPLYRMFCQVTGFGGTTQRGSTAPGAVAGREVTVRFDANTSNRLPWNFRPESRSETVAVAARPSPSPAPPPSTSPRPRRASISPKSSASASPSRR